MLPRPSDKEGMASMSKSDVLSTVIERKVTLQVPTASTRYLNELFALKCCGDLAPFFPNAKEVTESFALYTAARKYIGHAFLKDPNISVLCPGDGTAPRTAATFALRSRWTAYSVDPLMRPKQVNGRHFVDRLHAIAADANTFQLRAPRVLVASCHSHAKLSEVLRGIEAERIDIISLPCCAQDNIGAPTHTYRDPAVWSPQNRVNIYLDWKAPA